VHGQEYPYTSFNVNDNVCIGPSMMMCLVAPDISIHIILYVIFVLAYYIFHCVWSGVPVNYVQC